MYRKSRYITIIFAIFFVLSISIYGFASGNPLRRTSSSSEESSSDIVSAWSVPIETYQAVWNNVTAEEPTLQSNNASIRLQMADNVLLTQKRDGSYEIRMEYASFSIYDLMQVVNPHKASELQEKAGTKQILATPFGNYATPSEIQEESNYNKALEAGNISGDVNEYYLSETAYVVQTEEQRAMDTGYLYITDLTESDLSERWIIRGYDSRFAWSSSNKCLIVQLKNDKKTELPVSLSISEENAESGWEWTNYASAKESDGMRDNTTKEEELKALETLNALFEETVQIKKKEDGSLAALFTFAQTQEDPVTSVMLAESRDMSGKSTYQKQEFYNASWKELLNEESKTAEIPFRDLTEGKIIRVSTASLDESNEGKKESSQTYYYGTLWLKGYQEATEETDITELYRIPYTRIIGTWENYNSDNPDTDYSQSLSKLQLQDYVLVQKMTNGNWRLRFKYTGFSIWDTIAVIDPAYMEVLEQEILTSLPMPAFGKTQAEDYVKENYAAKDIEDGYISAEEDRYYLNSQGKAWTELADATTDDGYLYIETENLNQRLFVRAYSNHTPVAFRTRATDFIIQLDVDDMMPLQKDMGLSSGEEKMGFVWTNYVQPSKSNDARRDYQSNVLQYLNYLFENEVQVKKDDTGNLNAVFTLRDDNSGDPVTSISIAENKKNADNFTRSLTGLAEEYNEVTWKELLVEEHQEIVEVDFDDLMKGVLFRISTEELDKENADETDEIKKIYYYGTLWLNDEISVDAGTIIQESNGAKLITDDSSIPENAVFTYELTENPKYAKNAKQMLQVVSSYAKDDESWLIGDYYITVDGKEIIPAGPITVEIPIPEEFDLNRLVIHFQDGSSSGWGLPEQGITVVGELTQNDEGENILRISPTDNSRPYFSIGLIDPGTAVTQEELAELEEGYYEVTSTLRINNGTGPSMANPVIKDRRGILHVKEQGKDYDLYLECQGIYLNMYGYLSKMRVYYPNSALSEEAEVLSYLSTMDLSKDELEAAGHENGNIDNLMIDSLCEEHHLHYIRTLRLPLGDKYVESSNGWKIGVCAPMMNAMTSPDNMDAEKTANLRIIQGSIKKISDNDLAGYHPSILKAEIDNANWYLDTLSDGDIKEKLQQAITAAETEYENQKVSLDEPTLLEAVETLKKARLDAGDEDEGAKELSNGTYSIPYHLYDSSIAESDVSSEFEAYFAERATLKVEGDYMTVTLENESQKEDTVTNLEYETGAGTNFEQAESIQLDNGKSGFQFRRVYTEEAFELLIYTENQPLGSYARLVFEFDLAESISNPATEEEIEELRNLVSTLNTLVETEGSLYTESSLKNLQDAIDKAETVLSISELESDTVQTHIQNLENARDNLRKKADLEQDLKLAVEEAAVYLNGNYTEDSKAILQAAYDKAQNILDHLSDYTEAEIEEAIVALQEAEAGLIPSAMEDLSTLVDEYRQLTGEGYTEESWQKFQDALNEAQNILNREDAEPEDYEQALNTLKNAYEALETEIEDNEHLLKLSEILEQLKGELQDEAFYEASSYEAFLASVAASEDLLENGNLYEVTDEKIDLQIAALQAEFQALILIEDMPEGVQRAFNRVTFAKIDPELIEDVEMEEMLEEELEETEAAAPEETEAVESKSEEETEAAESKPEEETEAAESKPEEETEAAESKPEEETEAAESKPEEETEAAEPKPEEETEAKESEAEETNLEEADHKETEKVETDTVPRLSLSRRVLPLLASSYMTATPSNSNAVLSVPEAYALYIVDSDLEDGVYCVNYALWQFAENKASMGNPALMDAYPDRDGKQAKLVIEDSQAYLYLEFQAMEFNDQRGHLLEMYIMDNLVMEDNGEVIDTYEAVYPEIVEYTDETDDYGPPSGRKYPKLLKFDITKWMSQKETYIPVFVNVPVMGSSAEQPAKLRFYWNTLALVEGAGDPEDPEEQTVSTADLERLVEEAALVDPTGYTEASYYALEKSVMAADVLIQNAKKSMATQEMVDNRLAALEATLAALVENTSSGDTEDPDQPDTPVTEDPALKNLSRLIMEAALLYENDYTEESWKELRQALKSAVEVSYMDNPTSLAINRAYNTLKNAIENLEEAEELSNVNKTQLQIAIEMASALNSSDYTSETWLQLTMNLALARGVYSDANATQSSVDAATNDLKAAVNGLVSSTGNSGNDSDTDDSGSNEDDGYYEVKVRLWHASMNKASMGDPALNKTAYVHIDDGDITMRLVTKKMTTSGITTHLYDYYYYEDGDYEEAELISSENSKWIFEFPLPNDNDTYYKCKVDPRVDVMGDDPVKARLKVDWDSLDEVDEDDWDDLEGDVDDDDDDTTSSTTSSTSSNPTLQSDETGIRIYGNVGGPGIVLEVVKKENGAEYDMTHGSISSLVNQFVLYDVKLKSGTGYVQPTSSVTMQIPIPTGYDTSKLVLYRIGEDGSYTTISGKVNGSYYEATVDHFSLYALAESNQVTETAASSGNDSSSGGSSSGSSSRTRTTSSRTSSRTSSVQSNSSDTSGNHVAAGREIPYTGDPMPVKELAGVGFLAVVICLGTVLPDLRRKLESRKQQEE